MLASGGRALSPDQERRGGGALAPGGGLGDIGLEDRGVVADGDERDALRPADERRWQEGGGEAVAHELDERLRVVDFERDVALGGGCGVGAVDGDARAPGLPYNRATTWRSAWRTT